MQVAYYKTFCYNLISCNYVIKELQFEVMFTIGQTYVAESGWRYLSGKYNLYKNDRLPENMIESA